VILGDWRPLAEAEQCALDGFEVRLGLHAQFYGIEPANDDPEIGLIVTKRLLTWLDACLAVGADQMV